MISCQQKELINLPQVPPKNRKEPLSQKNLKEQFVRVEIPREAPKIISDFGSLTGVRGKKRKVPHQGVDIHDIPGTSILAARDGTILEIHDEKCWGLTVAIDHGPDPDGEKLYALYGHLGAHSVEQGTKVKRGQKKSGRWGMT